MAAICIPGHITNLNVNQSQEGKFTEAYLGLFGLFYWDNQSGLTAEMGGDIGNECTGLFAEQKLEY